MSKETGICIDSQEQLLVVVDCQRDFTTGVLGTPEAVLAVQNVASLLAAWTGPVLLTMDVHNEQYLDTQEGQFLPVPHCMVGSEGAALDLAVQEALVHRFYEQDLEKWVRNEDDIRRHSYIIVKKSQFGTVPMAEFVAKVGRNLQRIIVVGICTDICVITNALLLKSSLPEVPIVVYSDCCAGTSPLQHEAALAVMGACQIIIQ